MSQATFPTLLHSQARILGGLTRFDLVWLAGAYLALSALQVGGVITLMCNASLLLVIKLVQRRVPVGFWRFATSKHVLAWSHAMEGVCRT